MTFSTTSVFPMYIRLLNGNVCWNVAISHIMEDLKLHFYVTYMTYVGTQTVGYTFQILGVVLSVLRGGRMAFDGFCVSLYLEYTSSNLPYYTLLSQTCSLIS